MTQETKLGLVIGGAFILCFALILSHSKDQSAVDEQIASLLSASHPQPDVSELAGAGKAPHDVVQFTPRPVQPTVHEFVRPSHGSPVTDAASNTGASTTDQPNSPLDRKVIAQAGSGLETELRQSPSPTTSLPPPPLVTDVIANRPLPKPSGGAGVTDNSEQRPRTEANPSAGESAAARSAPAPRGTTTPPDPQPRRVQTYVVAKEDTLSKIARKFYGQATPENIEQIFRSNRTALPSKDALRVGQSLEIPLKDQPGKTAGIAETVNALMPVHPVKAQSSQQSEAQKVSDEKWEWYQVKPKDRYASIAQEKLGDKSRWKEIFELNKATFPDPDQIRPGVRIKVPQ